MANKTISPREMRDKLLAKLNDGIKLDVTSIWVTFQREGIHKYPAALTDPNLEDVSFLGYPHRHIFHFRVEIQVYNDDRDIEFIQFKRWLESMYDKGTLELDYKSCEMLAAELGNIITEKYPNRTLKVDVSEDGENGSSVYFGNN